MPMHTGPIVTAFKTYVATLICLSLSVISGGAHAHEIHRGIPNMGDHSVDWRTDQISRTMTFSDDREIGRVVTLDGKKCLEGRNFSFDVDDQYAFDIDEPVQVEVEFYQHREAVLPELNYEKNGEAAETVRGAVAGYKGGPRAQAVTFSLDRARFANRGLLLTDFSIALPAGGKERMTICNISLKRSYETVVPKDFGDIAVEVTDETGKAVPARVGIYDKSGRLPLPSEDAISVKRFDEMVRVVNISPYNPNLIPWPVRNRSGFYVNGSYHAKLPVGEYEIVVAKGPEYRFARQKFTVKTERSQSLKINLKRWDNLPAKGWYSGDNHIHYIRHDENDDPNLLLFTQAEDVHVANILQMGNIATAAWPQYGWQSVTAMTDDTYSFVPGQEDPRTSRRGHTISLRLKEPIRDPQHYLLFHEVFQKARAQGGVTGYAHAVAGGGANARAGLALDVPFGLVDFVEVVQFGYAGSNLWFDLLNLGYKLAPSAGTDYMFDFTLPGAERSYVHVPKTFSLQGWFDAFKRGETFATNGPMLEFTVNGQSMGAELRLNAGDRLIIDAAASINPDIDSLRSLELIEQGEVVKTVTAKNAGETTLHLHHEVTAKHGTWFVVRARGRVPHKADPTSEWETNQGSAKIALSGAIYVYVDGIRFWKPSEVPSIVQRQRDAIANLMTPETGDLEEMGTRDAAITFWDAQKDLLKQRIEEVIPIYDGLVAEARIATEKRARNVSDNK